MPRLAARRPRRGPQLARPAWQPRCLGVRERLPPINVHIHPRYKPIMPARRPLQDSSNGTGTRDLLSQDLLFLVWEVLLLVAGGGGGGSDGKGGKEKGRQGG